MADTAAETPVLKSETDEPKVDELKIDELKIDESKTSESKTDDGDAKPKNPQRYSFIERWEKRIEHLKSLPRDEEGLTGKVRFYSLGNRFGFIERDDNKESIYFHQASITASKVAQQPWFRTVNDGAAVKFDVVKTERGLEAVNLHSPGDEPLDEHEKFQVQFILTRIRAHRRTQAASKGSTKNDDGGEKKKAAAKKKPTTIKKEAASADGDGDDKKPKKKLRERKPKSSESEKKEDGENDEKKAGERRRKASEKSNATADPAAAKSPSPSSGDRS